MRIRQSDSSVEGLWIDRPDRSARLSDLPSPLQSQVERFVEDGYVIFEGAVPEETVDQIIEDVLAFSTSQERYVVRSAGKYVDPASMKDLGIGDRIIDLYAISEAARSAIHAPEISLFLETIFEEPAVAMQSLSFEYGSQQAIHQDTAYVISQTPLHLAASWIALEDVTPGSGELVYYPGSHRFDHFLFDGTAKGWNKKQHGDEQHKEFLSQLHEQARQRNIEKKSFLASKGDVLIWHADLAHGGERRAPGNDNTRRSLVTHYVPQSIKPKFFNVIGPDYYEYRLAQKDDVQGLFASRHYRMKDLETSDYPSIIYDGGVTKRRHAEGK